MTKDKIKIGVVGIGHLGNYHLEKYQKIPDVELIGVSDVEDKKAEITAAKYGCRAFKDYHDLIGAVDAVSIAVPTACHYNVARDFLAAGIDVLLEKPIAVEVEEGRELIELARRQSLIFQVGFVERFNPAIIALEKVLERPLFIEAHRLHPFFLRGTDVDVILDLMIHDLDIIIKFVKSPLNTVAAAGVSVLSEQVDIANVRLSFENGCVANVTASRVTAKTMQKIRFFAVRGYHVIDYGKREILSLGMKKDGKSQNDIVQNPVEVKMHDPLEMEIRSFVGAVIRRTRPLVPGEEALASLEIAAKIRDEIKTAPRAMS